MARIIIELEAEASREAEDWLEEVEECYGDVVGVASIRLERDE